MVSDWPPLTPSIQDLGHKCSWVTIACQGNNCVGCDTHGKLTRQLMLASLLINIKIWCHRYIPHFLTFHACLLTHCQPGSISRGAVFIFHGQYHNNIGWLDTATISVHTSVFASGWGCAGQSSPEFSATAYLLCYWMQMSHLMEVNRKQIFTNVNFTHHHKMMHSNYKGTSNDHRHRLHLEN